MRISKKKALLFIDDFIQEFDADKTSLEIADEMIFMIHNKCSGKLKSIHTHNGVNNYIKNNSVWVGKKKPWQIPSLVMSWMGNSNFQRMSTQIGNNVYMGSSYYELKDQGQYKRKNLIGFSSTDDARYVLSNSKLCHELSHHVISKNVIRSGENLSVILHGGMYALDVIMDLLFSRYVEKRLKKAFGGNQEKYDETVNKFMKLMEVFRVVVECFCYNNEYSYIESFVDKKRELSSYDKKSVDFLDEVNFNRIERAVDALSAPGNSYMIKLLTRENVSDIMEKVRDKMSL